MRLVFAGTPEVALPSLDALVASSHEVVAVVTRPDAPSGRGRAMVSSPVSRRARELGIEVLTPRRPSEADFQDRLRALGPDACPVVAYGALVPPAALAIPAKGWVNLHFSLLPAWRGAAPVQHAVLAGDEVTGATTFLLEQGLDTGPTLGVMTERIRPGDTSGDLLGRLGVGGAALLVASLDGLESGEIEPRPQPDEGVSLAPKLSVDDGRVRWVEPAQAVDRRIRACTPAPGAWTTFRGERVKLWPVELLADAPGAAVAVAAVAADPRPVAAGSAGVATAAAGTARRPAPGVLVAGRRQVLVGTGSRPVVLTQVQPHGKRVMPATDWARGVRILPGESLGERAGDG